MKSILNKKGQLNSLAPAVLALVFAAILLVLGLVMTQEFREIDVVRQDALNSTGDLVGCTSCAYGGANATVIGLATFADFWVIIVLAIVAVVVIGILITVFGRNAR